MLFVLLLLTRREFEMAVGCGRNRLLTNESRWTPHTRQVDNAHYGGSIAGITILRMASPRCRDDLFAGRNSDSGGLGVEVVYRLRLFWFSYSGKPGMNHVADEYFPMVHLASLTAMAVGLVALWMLRKRLWRWAAGSVAVLNIVLCAVFLVMHQTAVLVTYTEFVTIYGP